MNRPDITVERVKPKPLRGLCSVCGHDVALNTTGLVRAHAKRLMGKHGPFSSGDACDGAGLLPEVADVAA